MNKSLFVKTFENALDHIFIAFSLPTQLELVLQGH